MIIFDNNALVYLYRPAEDQSELSKKMKFVFSQLKEQKKSFGVPAPVLGEFLIGTKDAKQRQEFLAFFSAKSRIYELLSFDLKSAILSAVISDKLNSSSHEDKSSVARQIIKVDRQILAIAMSNNAEKIITNDKNLINSARELDLEAIPINDIEIPPSPKPTPDLFE